MTESLSYAVVTPAKDEADNLRRLSESLAAQTILPATWLVVDNGSTDETPAVVAELTALYPWIRSLTLEPADGVARGGPIVRAFHAGLSALENPPDLIGKVDADISMGPDYFARLLDAFAADGRLGMASGSCYELQGGEWRQRFGTSANVWGAARVYRKACLDRILPLDERMGWDGIDVVKANVRGWSTSTVLDLPFKHHRVEGARERGRWYAWEVQGDASHYMGYRIPYLVVRTLFQARRDPAALAMLWGFAKAVVRRAPRIPDRGVREYVRHEQRLRELRARRREALGAG